MKISIIIPLFNQLRYTQQMYESLQASLPESLVIEILFVDDGSSDDTPTWLRSIVSTTPSASSIKAVRAITNPINLGYAKSNNRAAAESTGDLLLLLNNDLVFKPGWLEPMLNLINDKQSTPVIVGNLQYLPDTDILDHAGIEVRIDESSDRPVIDHRRELISTAPEKVFAVTGACCLIARKTFEEVGGFDEQYLNGGEDVDLCMKVSQLGGACWIVPASRVWHHVSKTRGRQQERDEKNSWLLFQRWPCLISFGLERDCARLFVNAPSGDVFAKRIAVELLSGTRTRAPMAVKAIAQQYIQAESARLSKNFCLTGQQQNL